MITKKTKILIIGYGNFGQLLTELLLKYFDKVFVLSKNLKSASIKNKKIILLNFRQLGKIKKMDVVIPCVPISQFEKAIKKINPFLKDQSILIDVCSVKIYPKNIMQKFINKNVYLIN
ncbi:MAG: prephenate dehydrogenase/arogenate dehydrogenase family protein, partial [Candidatus Moranbacteria bacterium]|nr:prephenate dehydrogenase/arogenate dehydrogenase family protein [Candidatus Moranbacteria bacterium]